MEGKRFDARPKEKKKLIRTRRESNRIKILVTTAVLLIVAVIYYLVDSGSYVATVDGHRITKAEFLYFLEFQRTSTEAKNELTYLSQEEKDKFWMNPADGQDPWETAKRETLDNSKEIMIQLIKAKEAGLTIDSTIKSEVQSAMESYKREMTDRQFEQQVRSEFGISTNDFRSILENLSLIDRFKASYISKNYTPKTYSDEEIKAYYEKDVKRFDLVDISYISLYKYDENGEKLAQDKIDAKKKTAQEALDKINKGEDIKKVIDEYTEDEATEAVPQEKIGKSTMSYSTGTIYQELVDWVFDNKPGDTGIVETEYVLYVVRIEERTGFEDARANVKTVMENEAKQKFYEDAIAQWSLEPRYNIIVNERVYDSITYK